MKADKCLDCKWFVVMSYSPKELMCHYNWEYVEDVHPEECHFRKKKIIEEEKTPKE